MVVSDNEISLGHLPNSLSVFDVRDLGSCTQNFLYRFEFLGKRWIMKELRLEGGVEFNNLGNDAAIVARNFNLVYQIAKRHFGEQLLESHYMVARNRWGQPTMVTVQPEVEGDNLRVLNLVCDLSMRGEYFRVLNAFIGIWKSMKNDPEWGRLPILAQEHFAVHDLKLENIVRMKSGQYVIVDF